MDMEFVKSGFEKSEWEAFLKMGSKWLVIKLAFVFEQKQ